MINNQLLISKYEPNLKWKKAILNSEKPFQVRARKSRKPVIARKLFGKFLFRISKLGSKFHSKLRKAQFKTGLDRNCKNKNILEFDVEKDGGII